MDCRYATTKEISNWNTHLVNNPDGGNLFQMAESASIKQTTGWLPRYIMAGNIAVLALERRIPLLGAFWYLPKGPSVDSKDTLIQLLPHLKHLAAKSGVFALKIEPELPKDTNVSDIAIVKSFPVQPNATTVLLDLTPPLDDIMMALNQKGRHAIRRAERDGVSAQPVEASESNIDIMYELMRQTAEGQWNLRPKSYLATYWKAFSSSGHGQLFFAYYDGQVVAGSFGIAIGKNGTYKDGASIRKRTAYGASHLLQWEMIRWMKSRGVTHYDLCGAPSADRINDTTHPLHGVGRFKTSFNKTVTEYLGAYELPVHPLKFKLWKAVVERIVLRVNARFGNQEWY